MKSMRLLIGFLAATTMFETAAKAQVTPDFISVTARQNYVQTGSSTTMAESYSAGMSGPYSFVVAEEIDSGDLSGNTAPTFTVPGGSSYSGSTTLVSSGNNWRLTNYYSSSPFSGDFPNGTYTVTQPGTPNHTVSLDLSGNYFPSAPVATITGGSGTWSGSTLMVTAGTTLTFTTSAFAWDGSGNETNGALANHVGLFLSLNGSEVAQAEQFSNGADTYFSSGTGNPNYATITNYTFNSGSYLLEMEFDAIADVDTSYSTAKAVALYTSGTTFKIQVIPEPSTYAAILGAAALAGVMLHRRRRLA